MKKIGCNLCAGEYTIETHNSEQIRFCPVCGEPLEDYINIEEEDNYMDEDEWEEFEE
jgi:hypothetical protein